MPETFDFAIRNSFKSTIEDLQSSISYFDEQYMRTGDPNFAKYRDDNIRTLVELKEYILKRERLERERYGENQYEMFSEEEMNG